MIWFLGLLGQPSVAFAARLKEITDRVSPDVTPIPEGLPSADAASILCAVRDNLATRILRYLIYDQLCVLQGVTVYRAIKNSQTQQGDWIVLPGAGGGLGHLAVQYAAARGLRVIAIGGLFPPLPIH